jgi:predicted permease
LTAEDERPDAAPVVVIGYALWQRHFDGDHAIIGRTLRLGRTVHTIVGVMPQRFESPTGGALWVPLHLDVVQRQPGDTRLRVIGRLARGMTIARAQTELTAVGGHAASPDQRDMVTPRVEPYAASLLRQLSPLEFATITLFLTLLVVIICANVALLMFARAAAREGEIVVRSALGATRRRIIWQLFAEALVLAGVATTLGLIAADGVLRWGFGLIDVTLGPDSGAPGFWDRTGVSPATVFYSCLLAVLAALIAGVVPALKVTGALDGRLRMATAGGGGFRFGGVWTAVVVVQVAAMVAFPVLAALVRGEAEDIRGVQNGFASEEFLSARLEMDRETARGAPIDASRADFAARFGAAFRELEDRLEADGAVAGATFSDGPLLMSRGTRDIELDGGAAISDADNRGLRIKSATVAPDYFELLNAPAIAGRSFHPADTTPGVRVAIVNQSFVDRILGGANAVGRRVRYAPRPEPGEAPPDAGPWHEIIGVVRDIGRPAGGDSSETAGIYHPASPETVIPAYLLVHVKGRPESFVPRLRTLAAEVDPGMRIHEAVSLNEVRRVELHLVRLQFWLVTGLSGGALLLSLAGIHSVLSFTVSQRTREIGLRVALGGEGWRVAATVARRPLAQVAVGVLLGGALTAAMLHAVNVERSASGAARLLAYLALMIGVSLLAAIVPARRVLRIEPTEALKMEG